MSRILVLAPHPDDETLGCGGTLLRHAAAGDEVHWLLMGGFSEEIGYAREWIERRDREIAAVAAAYPAELHRLDLPDARFDVLPLVEVVDRVAEVMRRVRPQTVYLPFRDDAHSDHRVAFDAGVACTKPFRHPSVRRLLVYETPSETELALRPGGRPFHPNVFVDIGDHLERKIEIAGLYRDEMGEHPFPRSPGALRARAALHGSVAGCAAAEAFLLLREIHRDAAADPSTDI